MLLAQMALVPQKIGTMAATASFSPSSRRGRT